VRADRLARWYAPGYLAIGDAAHAMSPIGGVGINLAIQDAVAAANALWTPLRRGLVSTRDLAAVQRERELPTRVIQAFQGVIQQRFLKSYLATTETPRVLPLALGLLFRVPLLRDLPARLIALGLRRPHVRSPALAPRRVDGPIGGRNASQ
jgi:2-polyprenyl-6-methoxyphenol hydroxylase-like FAD-dependent oxidoreductase